MSIVSLHPELVSGSVTFSNRLLRLTPMMGSDEGPLWQMSPQPVRLEGGAPNVIHSSFASIVDSWDGSAGSVSENEHGLNGEFYFAPPYFDLLQQAALSAADLEITVAFAAIDGKIGTLMLSITNKTA